jgi:hypothetical protein
MLPLLLLAVAPPPAVVPLRHGHAHNDYVHPRPLLDALAHGFTSVEADVFLHRGELCVGHTWLDVRPGRTLDKLYLQPLARRARAGKGRIYPDGSPFYLLVDIKTEANSTYQALDRALARYADVLSSCHDGRFQRRAVTVVVSGNCPREVIRKQKVRYAGIDGRPGDLDSDEPSHLVPYISARWWSEFRWRGQGAMPEQERDRLRTIVKKAHRHGRLVRFWATPELPVLWRELRSAGVDLINTDQLAALRDFLLAEQRRND